MAIRTLRLAALALVAAWAVPNVIRLAGHWVAMDSAEIRTLDFTRYYATAVMGRTFGWSRLYDAAAQQHVAASLGISVFLPNVYTPFMSFFVWPFTLAAPEPAYFAWSALLIASLIVCCALAAPSDPLTRAVLLLILFVPVAVQLGLLHGQVIPVQMACVAIAYQCLGSGRDIAAGLLLLVLYLKPQGLQLLPLALLVAGHRRAFVAWLAGSALLAIGVVAVVHWEGVTSYVERLWWAQQHPFEMMVAWEYTLARRFDSPLLRACALLLVAALTLVTARRARGRIELVLSSAIVGSLLASPYLHLYDFLWLFLAGWLLFRALPNPWTFLFLAAVYVFVLFSGAPRKGARWVLLLECAWVVALAILPSRWMTRVDAPAPEPQRA